MEIITGKITDLQPSGKIIIEANYSNIDRFIHKKYELVEIGLKDGRTISPEQRKTIYALIGAISDLNGNLPVYIKRLMQFDFVSKRLDELYESTFSLSNCDMTLAYEFTKFLIDFVLEHDVPLKFDLKKLLNKDEIVNYIYACLKYKKCTICGKKGELHHIDTVGMGNDRTKIIHEGKEAMCLCPKHHEEFHKKGRTEFLKLYHLPHGIELNKELCKVWKLKAVKNDI